MYINPYETKIGRMLNNPKLVLDIQKYLITADKKELQYEYNTSGVGIIFITGKNQEERDLALWNHPMLVEDVSNKKYIVLDVRRMVSFKDEYFLNIENILRDKLSFKLVLLTALLMIDYLEDNHEVMTLKDSTATGFQAWIGKQTASVLGLDVVESIAINIVTLHYYLCIFNNVEQSDSTFNAIKSRISKLLPGNIKGTFINEVLENANKNPKNISDLVSNIRTCVKSDKTENIDGTFIYNLIGNNWFGLNADEVMAISLENSPYFISMMYLTLSENNYKKTRLSILLKNAGRKLEANKLVKILDNKLKDAK